MAIDAYGVEDGVLPVCKIGSSDFCFAVSKSRPEHGPVRVGYMDNYLAFCDQDGGDGALTGALRDFLALASHSMQNAEIAFDPIPFTTTADALEALKNGGIDCVFPVSLSMSDAEDLGVLTTSPQMQSEMFAVVRSAALGDFSWTAACASRSARTSPMPTAS